MEGLLYNVYLAFDEREEEAIYDVLAGSVDGDLLADVHRRANPEPTDEAGEDEVTVPGQIEAHGITHLQCTPSYAELVLAQPGGREGLAKLDCLMVGGEALPLGLARELDSVVGGTAGC